MDREQEEVLEEKEEWMQTRKRWIHREVEVLKEMYGSVEVEADLRWEMEAKGGADAYTSLEVRGSPNGEDVGMTGMGSIAIK